VEAGVGAVRSGADPRLDGGADRGVDRPPVPEGALEDRLGDAVAQDGGDGVDEAVTLVLVEYLTDQGARLAEVVVLGVEDVRLADHLAVGLPAVVDAALEVRVRPAHAVGGVDGGCAGVVVGHGAVGVVRVRLDDRPVDGQLVEVRADAGAVGVRVGEHPAEQHLVGGEPDAGHDVGRREAGLLDLREEVRGVLVQGHDADLVERVVRVRPDLGEVEGVEAVGLRVLVGHDLHGEAPLREVPGLDRVEEVTAVEVRVRAGDLLGLLAREVLDALQAVEVILDPEALAGGVDPHVGVGAVAVHGAPRLRQAAVTHEVGDLVRRLRVQRPEVPLHVVVPQARVRQALLRADEVGELHGVADEEDRGVVPDHVVVALGGVELQREAAHVPPGVGGAEFAGHGGEAGQHPGLDAGLEEGGLRPTGDVRRRLELAERAGALGVRAAFRDVLAVEVGERVHEVHVVQQEGAVGREGQGVPVARGRRAVRLGGT